MRIVLLTILLSLTSTAWADLDDHDTEALQQTQDLLRSQSSRDSYIQANPDAQQADAKVKALSNSPGDRQAVYDLSARVFDTTTRESNGDVEKQKAMLLKAGANPEEFLNSLPEDQKASVRGLAEQIEKNNQHIGGPR